MIDVPDDVKKLAADACPTFVSSQAVYSVYNDCIAALENSIMAERERCAKIAEEVGRTCSRGWYKNPGNSKESSGIAASNTALLIEDAIRGKL